MPTDSGQRSKVEEFDSLSTQGANCLTSPAFARAYAYAGRLAQWQVGDRNGTVIRTISYSYDRF